MGTKRWAAPPPHSHRHAIPAARAHQDMVRWLGGSIRPLPETAKTPWIEFLSVALMDSRQTNALPPPLPTSRSGAPA